VKSETLFLPGVGWPVALALCYRNSMGFFSRLLTSASGKAHHQPRILAHIAFDGAIRVFESPTSEGWQNSENHRAGDGFTVMVLKYILPMSPMPLALLAKIYTVEGTRDPPEDPKTTDWRAAFQALFSTFSGVETRAAKQLTMTDSLDAFEAVLDGIGAEPAVPLRVRERRARLGSEQFIVTAMGSPVAFEEHADEIDRWFSTSAFVPFKEKAKS
jgi:hypothetical protein